MSAMTDHLDDVAIAGAWATPPDPADAEALRNLLQAYAVLTDAGAVDALAGLFTADAEWDGTSLGFGTATGPERDRPARRRPPPVGLADGAPHRSATARRSVGRRGGRAVLVDGAALVRRRAESRRSTSRTGTASRASMAGGGSTSGSCARRSRPDGGGSAGEEALRDGDQGLADPAVGAAGERPVDRAHGVDEDRQADQRAGGQRLGGEPAAGRTRVRPASERRGR